MAADPATLSDALDAALDSDHTGLPRDPQGMPYVDDQAQADWALRKLARLRGRAAQVDRLADDQIAKINQWRDAEKSALQPDVDFFVGLLTDWHRRLLAEDGRTKSVSLPSGRLTSRATQPKVRVGDVDAVVEWIDDPELLDVLVPETPAVRKPSGRDWNRLAREGRFEVVDGRLVDTVSGEVVPGVTAEPAGRRFAVETPEVPS